MCFLIGFLNFKIGKITRLEFGARRALAPSHISAGNRCGVITETHRGFVAGLIDLHHQAHQVTARNIFVAVPIRIFVTSEFLWRRHAAVGRGGNCFVRRAPAAVRLVIATQPGAHNFVSLLLRRDVDGGVNRQTSLRDARGVLVFQILTNVLDRIIERRRERLRRLVISRVGQHDRFRFRRINFRLGSKSSPGHQVEHQIAALFRLGWI